MTIEECIAILSYPTYYFPSVREEALDMTIDTMRKYQKIEEAYKKYLNDMAYFTNIYADGKFIKALREVLEDGKID